MRVLIVDDERLARAKLRQYLATEPDVTVVGECATGPEALAALRAARPDLLFLDVQMPGLSGIELLEALEPLPCAVILVTAHERYAVRAFELEALDYLLKPFDRDRFARALERARAAARRPARAVVRDGDRLHVLRVDEIDWIESADNYVAVHAGGAEHLLREALVRLEARLDPARFVRIHRRAIVNLDAVAEVHEHEVRLRTGAVLPLGRRYRKRFLAMLA